MKQKQKQCLFWNEGETNSDTNLQNKMTPMVHCCATKLLSAVQLDSQNYAFFLDACLRYKASQFTVHLEDIHG